MPHLERSPTSGSQAPLGTVLPAVTCAAQSTFLTGATPAEHGIVGNGWYFRELGDVLLWRQHNGLVAGDKLWDAARRAHPGYTVANICWWYAMGADTDCHRHPPSGLLRRRPQGARLLHPAARPARRTHREPSARSRCSTSGAPAPTSSPASWIIDATRHILRTRDPDLALCYLPHLDYDLQRFGPDDPRSHRAAAELDAALAPLLDDAAPRAAPSSRSPSTASPA